MGTIQHHAIIVTHWNPDDAARARQAAIVLGCAVSELHTTHINGVGTFCVFPDGSRDGWEDSNAGDKQRDSFVAWLRADERFADEETWVEVAWGELGARVVRGGEFT